MFWVAAGMSLLFFIVKKGGKKLQSLIVIYDKNHANKGTLSYLSAIKKTIKNYVVVDIEDLDGYDIKDGNKVLVLKPMSKENEKKIKDLYKDNPSLDVEGQWTSKFTTTAAAILEILQNMFKDKRVKVAIINQSETLGLPLAKKMLDLGYGVLSFNTLSTVFEIEKTLSIYNPDIIITATGNDNFSISVKDDVPVIDLSNDVKREENVIRHIPTVHVLKNRLEPKLENHANASYDK